MTKKHKIIAAIAATPLVLVVLATALLYFPPFQNWAVKQATSYASELTGMSVSINHVRLTFPLDLTAQQVVVCQDKTCNDTLASIDQVVANVRLLPLLHLQVMVDEFSLQGVHFNTDTLVAAATVKGRADLLRLSSESIKLDEGLAKLNDIQISGGDIDVTLLNDTTQADTTQANWVVMLDSISIKNTHLNLLMAGDSMRIGTALNHAIVSDATLDLAQQDYRINCLRVHNSAVTYDMVYADSVASGLDPNHISLSDLHLSIDSLHYGQQLGLSLNHFSFKERCGLQLNSLAGHLMVDDMSMTDTFSVLIPDLVMLTPHSTLAMNAVCNLQNTVLPDREGESSFNILHSTFNLDACIGKRDLLLLLPDMGKDFRRNFPDTTLCLTLSASGTPQDLELPKMEAYIPGCFTAKANGHLTDILDGNKRRGNLKFNLQAHNVRPLIAAFAPEQTETVAVPRGTTIGGTLSFTSDQYNMDLNMPQKDGLLKANGFVNLANEKYKLLLQSSKLNLNNFLPSMGLGTMSATFEAEGQGFNPLAPNTQLNAQATIDRLPLLTNDGQQIEGGMEASARIKDGKGYVSINSHNDALQANIDLSALLDPWSVDGTLSLELQHVDLYKLGITQVPFSASACLHTDLALNVPQPEKRRKGQDTGLSNLFSPLSSIELHADMNDVTLRDSSTTYRPGNLEVDAFSRPDSTMMVMNTGDFSLDFTACGGIYQLADQVMAVANEAQQQYNQKYIDQQLLRQTLPTAHLKISSGQDNVITRFLKANDISLNRLKGNITSSSTDGLNGWANMEKLVASGIQIDRIGLTLRSDSTDFDYQLHIENVPGNPQVVFRAELDGSLSGNSTSLHTVVHDAKKRKGADFTLVATMQTTGGIRVTMDKQPEPILGYKVFHVNNDNYLTLSPDGRLSANLRLHADDGQGVLVYSDDDNEAALQDITFTLYKFDLEETLSFIPYLPKLGGVLDGDFHVVQEKDRLSISSNMDINQFSYEDNPMGNLGSEFVYIPYDDGRQYIDGMLTAEGIEVCSLKGTYKPGSQNLPDSLDAVIDLTRFPLDYANGFVPDRILGLRGYGNGHLTATGPLTAIDMNGEIMLESAFVFSEPYGVELRFADAPVKVKNSRLQFDNFTLTASNGNPLSINGYVDFANLDDINMQMRMRANNFLLINAKQNVRSEAFGKAYVNFLGFITGKLEALRIRGQLNVLGSTDMTYILRDSPLTTDNQLDELVRFTNFADTTQTLTTQPPQTGLEMDLSLNIDESAHILCALNAEQTNYVDLMGGGELRMKYNATDNIRLTGRYTLSNGEMKYSLPVIPLKTFTVQDGSYVEFTGDPFNPTLNITALEQTKASVSSDGGGSRSVMFNCGVIITKTLNDMGLEFVIDAPEDLSIHNELQTMSTEARGKLAVTMLTTGMYLAEGNTNAFTMNSVLSAFLNSQINNISSNALRTLDLSFGMENSTDAAGSIHTDYSFKFAKRFWNNRLRIVVGGKLSTGADVANQNNSFFDNVVFEYRMSDVSNKYLKLFYERDSYDWLEGYVSEFGGGFLWKKKVNKLSELFKRDSNIVPGLPTRMPANPAVPTKTVNSKDSLSITTKPEEKQ